MEIEKIIFYPKCWYQFWRKKKLKFKIENYKIILEEPSILKNGESIEIIYKIILEG